MNDQSLMINSEVTFIIPLIYSINSIVVTLKYDGAPQEVLNYRRSQQTEGRGWYVVDDYLMAQRPMPGLDRVTSAIIARVRSAGAKVVSANSLDELRTKLAEHGLPASVVMGGVDGF